ncbi:O-antigen ligase family protein [Methylocystis echinoides]|uniref:O-antigen ligase family protein n=1 Tax=Methylocystis echinoides TaxID=29468 RepID=UPI00248F495E|nr:O-antigen ligase family protein [Methylocystis echinoides]
MALIGSALAVAPLLVVAMPIAPIAVSLLPLALVFAFPNPFLLCLAFVIFSFFRIHEAFPALNPLHIPQLLALATLMVLCWQVFLARSIRTFWSRELSVFAVFFTLVTLGLPLAASRPTAITYWTATYSKIAIMTVAIAWLTRTPRDFALASRAFVFAGAAIAAVTLYNKANGIGLVEGTRVTIGRDIQSVLGDPNDLSLVLLFPLSFATSLFIRRTGWISALFGFLATLMIITAIIATQSRGGLLGLMTVFAIVGSRVIKSKAVLISIGVVAAIGLFAVAGISGRSSGGAGEEGIDESSMGRIYAWGAAWHMALKHPLNGVGVDNFVDSYFAYSEHWDGHNHAVHSTWFGVLGETGFPGILVFLFLIYTIARSAFDAVQRLDRPEAPASARAMSLALLAGIAGFCVSGTFLTQGFTWPVYVLLALTTAISRFAKSDGDLSQSATDIREAE